MPWIKTQNITGPQGPQGPSGPFSRLPESDLHFYVATDGSDSEGDGSEINPWATPHRAMEELWTYLIPPGTTAVVHVADGDYTLLKPLVLDHPSGQRITMTGGTVTGSKPDSNQLNGLQSSVYTPESAAANQTALRGYYNTCFIFPETAGLQLRFGSGITLERLLLIGTRAWTGIELAPGTAINLSPNGDLALHEWSAAIQGDGSFTTGNISITNCYQGVFAGGGTSSMSGCLVSNTQRPLTIKGSAALLTSDLRLQYGDRGIFVLGSASLECYGTFLQTFSGNGLIVDGGSVSGGVYMDSVAIGVQLRDGRMDLQASRFSNCSQSGFQVSGGSFSGFNNEVLDTPIGASVTKGGLLKMDQLRFTRCTTVALQVDNAQALVYASRYTSCAQGITCKGGRVYARSALFSAMSGTCLTATSLGLIDYEAGDAATTASPAFNTSGNGNAYILL